VAFFQCGGLVFALWGREALADDAGVQANDRGFANVSLAYNVRRTEEVDATLADAERAGARILRQTAETSWGGRTAISPTLTASRGRSPGTRASRSCPTAASGCGFSSAGDAEIAKFISNFWTIAATKYHGQRCRTGP
jgi:hypothetical protein